MCVRAVFLSALCAIYLYGANDPQAIVSEVAKLRQKYEECRQEQNALSPSDTGVKIKGYQQRIAALENQIKQNVNDLAAIKKHNTELERDLSQKKGVIQSLEKVLTTKDQRYRETVAHNERLLKETNTIKVGKIERESLKSALVKAKSDLEQLEKSMGKTDKEAMALRTSLAAAKAEIERLRAHSSGESQTAAKTVATPHNNTLDQTPKIKALQNELAKANVLISQLQKGPAPSVVQEKIVTKIIEPTEKIVALQRELASAQATITALKKGVKTVTQEKIVEKVVYKERPVVQEKIIEKIVYKERPVIQEKIVEKVVYKERPVSTEKVLAKTVNPTEQLNRVLHQKLTQNEVQTAKLKLLSVPKSTPLKTAKSTVQTPDKSVSELKAPATASVTHKKSGPSAYRMATNAAVYNAPGGSVVDTWEARRSFTSGTEVNGWVKITGYFVNRVWQRADQDLWVKESDVIRR